MSAPSRFNNRMPRRKMQSIGEFRRSKKRYFTPSIATIRSDESAQASIYSPEGVVVLFFAIMLDVLGIVLNIFGIGVVVTVIGLPTLGVWVWVRGGKVSLSKKAGRFAKKAGVTAILETISFGLLPGWTVMVLRTLKK